MLRARGVSYRYGGGEGLGVVDADLEVAPGTVLGLVGPNGAGKSTLLRLLDGSLEPDRGEVEGPPRRAADGRMTFGYAADSDAHFECLSGWYNANFFARCGGLSKAEAESAVSDLMGALGLREDALRPVSEYSFGARRKLTLLEALVHEPAFLLLDEPTVGLDATSRDALAGLLRRRAAAGLTTILASHDLGFVVEVADRVVFMNRGKVLDGGRPAALLADLGDTALFEIMLAGPLEDSLNWPEGLRVLRTGSPLLVESQRGHEGVVDVVRTLVASGARIRTLAVREPGLADAFRRISGEELDRDPSCDLGSEM